MSLSPPRAIPSAPRWRRHHLLVLGLVALLGAVTGWITRERELLVVGDEPVYVALSHSIAAGRYHDEYLASAPAHAHYPPGMSVWMLGLRLAVGGDPEVVRAANFLLVLLTVFLMADLIRRISTPWTGVMTGALTALSPLILDRAGTLYAESLFMALATLGLWAAQRSLEDGRRRWLILALGATLGGFLTRLAGVAMLAGLWAAWVRQRAWRVVTIGGVVMALVVGAWGAYTVKAATGSIARSYGGDFAARLAAPEIRETDRLLRNTRTYLVQELPTALQVPTVQGTPLDNLLTMALLGSMGLVGLGALLRAAPATGLALLANAAMLVLWIWPNARFLTPLLPMIFGMLAVGAHRISQRLGRLGPLPMLVLVALTGAPALVHQLTRTAEGVACDATQTEDPTACYPPEQRGYVALTAFIRDHLPVDAVIIGESPAMTHFLSGRRGIPARVIDPATAATGLEPLLAMGATHILFGPSRAGELNSPLLRLLEVNCGRLTTLATAPGALLLGLPDSQGPGTGGCQAIEEYLQSLRRLPANREESTPDHFP